MGAYAELEAHCEKVQQLRAEKCKEYQRRHEERMEARLQRIEEYQQSVHLLARLRGFVSRRPQYVALSRNESIAAQRARARQKSVEKRCHPQERRRKSLG